MRHVHDLSVSVDSDTSQVSHTSPWSLSPREPVSWPTTPPWSSSSGSDEDWTSESPESPEVEWTPPPTREPDIFELLNKLQGERLNDQRCMMPGSNQAPWTPSRHRLESVLRGSPPYPMVSLPPEGGFWSDPSRHDNSYDSDGNHMISDTPALQSDHDDNPCRNRIINYRSHKSFLSYIAIFKLSVTNFEFIRLSSPKVEVIYCIIWFNSLLHPIIDIRVSGRTAHTSFNLNISGHEVQH